MAGMVPGVPRPVMATAAGLQGLQPMQVAGAVPGHPGQPVLVRAPPGAVFLPRHPLLR